MMARSRQRSGGLFVPPPSLPDDDPYGDAAELPAAETAPPSPAEDAPAPTPKTPARKRAKAASKKAAPSKTVGERGKTAAPAPKQTDDQVPAEEISSDAAGADVQVQLYIPAALHAAIADYKAEHWRGNETPTYAQLSVWACEDHRSEVIERARTIHRLRYGATKDVRGNRSPRGTRKAKPQVPIGPRYSQGDAAFLEEMTQAAGSIDDKQVRRTTLVAASLAVAVKHPPQERPAEDTETVDEFFG